MRRFLNHVLFWIGYILFKVIINLTDDSQIRSNTVSELSEKFILIAYSQLPYFVIYIPLVYLLFYIIDRYFSDTLSLTSSILFSFAAFILALPLIDVINHEFILPVVYGNYNHPLTFDFGSLIYYAFNLVSVVGIACSLKLIRKQLTSKVMEQSLQKEKIEAELKFLKAQVSPHFLFNTLNNIYSLARKQRTETAEAVMKLSKLLRFMLHDASNKSIPLSEELKLIEDYIELEKLRYDDRLTVSFRQTIDNPGQLIAPLILIHFVENAFKHGAGESRFTISIDIEIVLCKGQFSAMFSNTKENQSKPMDTNQIGLSNIKRQLELIYPSHELIIKNDPNLFIVKLNLSLT